MRRKRCLILLLLWLVLPYPLFAENSDAPALKEKPQQKTAGGTINRATDDDVARLQEIVVTTSRLHNPVTPVTTRYATQYNVVTEEQIKEQSSPDFLSALRNVPGVMFQSKNLMGGQSSHSMYIRGRGASHPGSDFAILYDDVPRFGALFGQVMGDGIALSTIGSIEIFKSPQPSEFGSGYASLNYLRRLPRGHADGAQQRQRARLVLHSNHQSVHQHAKGGQHRHRQQQRSLPLEIVELVAGDLRFQIAAPQHTDRTVADERRRRLSDGSDRIRVTQTA